MLTRLSVHDKDLFESYKTLEEAKTALPAGAYTIKIEKSMMGVRYFYKTFKLMSDSILDLPSPEFSSVVSEMRTFLKPETKAKFKEMGYLYKRSTLLHGAPGTGKTVIINRVAADVIAQGGIVLFIEDPRILPNVYADIEAMQPDTTKLVIFEELDSILQQHESQLLTLLDGEVQTENVMYLATTNFIDRIPARLRRPGRFSTVLEVKAPNKGARLAYLSTKLASVPPDLVQKSKGLTVDELKELVQAVYLFGASVDSVVERIRANKGGIETPTAPDYDFLDDLIDREAKAVDESGFYKKGV